MTRADSIVCAQIGAREHYAVPRALSRLNYLDTLLTDAWSGSRVAGFSARLGVRGPFVARHHSEVPDRKVMAFTASTIADAITRRFGRGPQRTEAIYDEYIRIGRRFASRVRLYLERRGRSGSLPSAFFAYTTGALEALEYLRSEGVSTLVDQIDPGRVEDEMVRAEAERWPGWMSLPGTIPGAYFDRIESEWAAASRVVVNSEWSRQALVRQGVPVEKILLLPIAYEPPPGCVAESGWRRDVTVLWLGQVVLRKGIQYLIEAARELRHTSIRFVIAGPIAISSDAVKSSPRNMTFIGPVSRDRISELFAEADLFVLPTLSDGFGVAQLEAMAHGLPVITTANCGEVVTDGVDGRIVPARDSGALVRAIDELASNRDQRRAMSAAACETSKRFSLDVLAGRLKGIVDDLV